MIDPTLGALCLATLDGRQDVIGSLADRMTELGNGDADKVRGRKRLPRDARLRFVIYALPLPVREVVAFDFVEHVLPVWERAFPLRVLPRLMIQARRAWARGELRWQALEALLPDVSTFYRSEVLGKPSHERGGAPQVACAASMVYGLSFGSPDVGSDVMTYELNGTYVQSKGASGMYEVRFIEHLAQRTYCSAEMSGYRTREAAYWAVEAVGREQRRSEQDWQLDYLRRLINRLCGFAEPAVSPGDAIRLSQGSSIRVRRW